MLGSWPAGGGGAHGGDKLGYRYVLIPLGPGRFGPSRRTPGRSIRTEGDQETAGARSGGPPPQHRPGPWKASTPRSDSSNAADTASAKSTPATSASAESASTYPQKGEQSHSRSTVRRWTGRLNSSPF